MSRLEILIDEISAGNVSDFAKKAGIKQATLYNYTQGRVPNGENLYNICNNLGVSIDWLLAGKGERYLIAGADEDGRKIDYSQVALRVVDLMSFTSEKDFASELGLSFDDYVKRRDSGTLLPVLLDWANTQKINIYWLLTGNGEPYLKAIEDPHRFTRLQEPPGHYGGPPKAIELGHGDILKRFSDKTYARDLSKCLLELERLDPVAYREVGGIIKGVVLGLHRKSRKEGHPPTDRRRTDRRAENRPDLIPNGKDRRTGAERRSTSGGKE